MKEKIIGIILSMWKVICFHFGYLLDLYLILAYDEKRMGNLNQR